MTLNCIYTVYHIFIVNDNGGLFMLMYFAAASHWYTYTAAFYES